MAQPVISIVCGTYRRLDTLKRMVQSVRDTLSNDIYASVPYEFIIADNASNDGTWEWLESQPDITPLQMGAPVGAIKAFTEAAYQATGDYVVLATDDIYFPPYALMTALRWLETTADCGVVAFAHNKDGHFRTDKQKARTASGEKSGVIYPQICMVRRWLGDVCGWWGGNHDHMQASFTYGGDNFLGSRIIELGYKVDEVEGCVNIEATFQDESRGLSSARHRRDFDNYWSLYPDGPTIADAPQIENPQREQLRTLISLHYDPRWKSHKTGKVGMTQAFRRLGHVVEYDYALAQKEGRDRIQDLVRLAEAWKPHIIFTQAHNGEHGFPLDVINEMRRVSPRSVCVNWNGDYWPKNIEREDTQHLYRQYDLILVQTVYLAERLCELGICAAYIPHSFEPCEPVADAPGYDVIWAGNAYNDYRRQLIEMLSKLPYSVGLYGQCAAVQMTGATNYEFALTRGMHAKSLIAVGEMNFDEHTARGFVSNRLWEIMAAGGALCLQQYVPMLEELTGLRDGVHLVWWRDMDDLRQKIDYYMAHPDEARAIARNAYAVVHEQHSFDVRIRNVLTEILPGKLNAD
jgi:glycosyltransferase involved in cell wall biosynthesis